jgi:hypothetical protein
LPCDAGSDDQALLHQQHPLLTLLSPATGNREASISISGAQPFQGHLEQKMKRILPLATDQTYFCT